MSDHEEARAYYRSRGPVVASVVGGVLITAASWWAIGAPTGPFALLIAAGIVACGLTLVRAPVLSIGGGRIEFVPSNLSASWAPLLFWGGTSNVRGIIESADVDALEWDGHDNVGVRLHSGRVVGVPFLNVSEAERADAHARILAFVASSNATSAR